MPLQHWLLCVHWLPVDLHRPASASLLSPSVASAIPARPTPNCFSAPRRVTDWAIPLASSSNLSFIIFFWLFVLGYGMRGEILIPGATTAPFTTSVLLSGVPSIGSFNGLA